MSPQDTRSARRPSARSVIVLAGTLAVAALIVAGILVAGRMPSSSASRSQAGGKVPAISGRSPITGRQIGLAAFAGRPVVINVWASWCTDCNEEAHALVSFARSHPQVQVLGLDISDTAGGARAFYRKWHVPYPSISDPEGTLSAKLAVTGVPTTLFLDARHHVVERMVGAGKPAAFEKGLRRIEQSAQ